MQKYIESRNALVLGVSWDEDPDAYEKFLKDQGIDFPTFREPTKKVALEYGTPVIPDTYIIDRHGKILRKFYGAQQWDSPEMLAYFDQMESLSKLAGRSCVSASVAAEGKGLHAGQLVLTGSLVKTLWLKAGDKVRMELDGLGTVEAEFT